MNINIYDSYIKKILERILNNSTRFGRLRYPQRRKTYNYIIINRLYFKGILCRIRNIMSTNITIYITQSLKIPNL